VDTAGVVKADKYQKKTLSTPVTSTGVISDLTFSGLTPGKSYEIDWNFLFDPLNGGATGTINLEQPTSTTEQQIVKVRAPSGSTNNDLEVTQAGSYKFVADGTTVSFNVTAAISMTIVATSSYAILTELNSTVLTSDFA